MNNDETKLAKRKERYLRDPLPVRLGNLASNLARIKSFAARAESCEAVGHVIRESEHFIRWTGSDTALPVQKQLVVLQQQLACWEDKRVEIWNDSALREELATQASQWSQQLLRLSGLLNP